MSSVRKQPSAAHKFTQTLDIIFRAGAPSFAAHPQRLTNY